MAQEQNTEQSTKSARGAKSGLAQRNPLDDMTYDWVTILHSKAQGLNAYEKYLQDAEAANADECRSLLQELYEQDVATVEKVRKHLMSVMREKNSDAASTSSASSSSSSSSSSSKH